MLTNNLYTSRSIMRLHISFTSRRRTLSLISTLQEQFRHLDVSYLNYLLLFPEQYLKLQMLRQVLVLRDYCF